MDQACTWIKRTWIKPHRVKAGEPPHRARQVEVGGDLLAAKLLAAKFLAAMTLDIDQHGGPVAAAAAMPPAPVRDRQRQAGQQHIVDAGMERRRHAGQQRPRHAGGQRQRELPGGAGQVAGTVERTVEQ